MLRKSYLLGIFENTTGNFDTAQNDFGDNTTINCWIYNFVFRPKSCIAQTLYYPCFYVFYCLQKNFCFLRETPISPQARLHVCPRWTEPNYYSRVINTVGRLLPITFVPSNRTVCKTLKRARERSTGFEVTY